MLSKELARQLNELERLAASGNDRAAEMLELAHRPIVMAHLRLRSLQGQHGVHREVKDCLACIARLQRDPQNLADLARFKALNN